MQIKSWQIALAGSIPNILILLYIVLNFFNANFSLTQRIYSLFFVIGIILVIIIPVLCFRSRYLVAQKIGAIISIFFGLLFLSTNGIFNPFNDIFSPFGILIIYFPGICYLVAGIYYFWKKV